MILGRTIGKTSTIEFKFLISGNAKKLMYVQAISEDGEYALGQIIEIEKDKEGAIAHCVVLGIRDKEGVLRGLRYPLEPGIEILEAEDETIVSVLGINNGPNFAYVGKVEGREKINVFLDINKLLSRHISIIAKSGSGKSYTVGVLLEELLEKNIPVLVIDPHGEYSSLKFPNEDKKDIERMSTFDIKPKGYLKQVVEFSPDLSSNPMAVPLKLDVKNLNSRELINLLPAKLSNTQLGVLYSTLKNVDRKIDLNELMYQLELEENPSKWTLISIIEYLIKLDLFSSTPTNLFEVIAPNRLSIVNLKGIQQDVAEVIVYKLLSDLFMQRKKGNIPPFFLVLEEAHNFVPERNFGEAKSSEVIRSIFSEGRKFGVGACLITQRPSRVDKNALSQCNCQIILKVTNPNDIKTISSSVEGISLVAEKEIINLPVGTAIITGVIDMPLFVNIRPRRSKHGGTSINIFDETKDIAPLQEDGFTSKLKDYEGNLELLAVVSQRISANDFKIIYNVSRVKTKLIPCALYTCFREEEFNVLVNLSFGNVVTDYENGKGIPLKFEQTDLSNSQKKIFSVALSLKTFSAAELFAKSGFMFSEVYDMINLLTNKGYLSKVDGKYEVAKNFSVLSKLKDFSCYEKVEFSRINFDEKLQRVYSPSDIKDTLSRFFDVKEVKECFLVVFEPAS